MDEMITVYLYGKKYTVPSSLTIMEAFEYSGYQLVRGCGCRNGFCGACATIYRIKGETTLHGCLASSVLPVREGDLQHRGDPSDSGDHDAAVSGDLFLYRM